MERLKRAIEISRPIFWPSTFFAFLLGVLFSHHPISPKEIAFACIWAFPYSLWLCTVNDLSDKATDNLNKFKGKISGIKVQTNEDSFIKKLAILSLAIILAPTIFFANLQTLFTSVLAIIIPFCYSIPLIRLKEKPFLDSLSNGAFVTTVFLTGYFLNGATEISPITIQACLGFLFGVSGVHVVGALRDYSSDKKAGVRTISVALGQRQSALVAACFFTLLLTVLNNFPIEFKIYSIYAIMAAVILAIYPNEKRSMIVGLSLLLGFFLTANYSIASGSWRSLF